MSLSIITTKDGSHTVQVDESGDTYHSVHGAVQESNHVFIENGLMYFFRTHRNTEINILEVGFGTGLNAWLTLQRAIQQQIKITYVTIEPNPLGLEQYQQLNYAPNTLDFFQLHESPWNEKVSIHNQFKLKKLKTTLQQAHLPELFFDVVYFDAFAPNSQPELWTVDIFKKIKGSMAAPSVFVTYCAKGQVKRDLKSLGFVLENLPGPPGKREMIRGVISNKQSIADSSQPES